MEHKKDTPNPPEYDVCSSSGWSAAPSQNFNFLNQSNAPILVSQNGTNTFPFVVPGGGNSFSVDPPKTGCQLIAQSGRYTYNSNPCTGEGNPKVVIIT